MRSAIVISDSSAIRATSGCRLNYTREIAPQRGASAVPNPQLAKRLAKITRRMQDST